jgi:hypothetical protein
VKAIRPQRLPLLAHPLHPPFLGDELDQLQKLCSSSYWSNGFVAG